MLENVANGSVVTAALGILLFVLREWRKIRLANNKTEQTTPLEIRSAAATTFEAEQAAARKSFDQDRAVKDNTIVDLNIRIEELKSDVEFEHGRFIAERDKRRVAEAEVEILRNKAREMQRQIEELLDTIEEMSDRLTVEREHEDDALHTGPGS